MNMNERHFTGSEKRDFSSVGMETEWFYNKIITSHGYNSDFTSTSIIFILILIFPFLDNNQQNNKANSVTILLSTAKFLFKSIRHVSICL